MKRFLFLALTILTISCNDNKLSKIDKAQKNQTISKTNLSAEKTIKSDRLTTSNEILLIDIDKDKVIDSVYIDIKTSQVTCKLSSNNYEKMSSKSIKALNEDSGINKTNSGFEFYNNWMKVGCTNQFRYNPTKKKVELIGMSYYTHGVAVGNGSGESSVNLLTGDYFGKWYYFDEATRTLTKMPFIRTKMNFKSIYLEDFNEEVNYDYFERSEILYSKQREKMYE
jgi:hypothetical protein